ncbi:hypothetical protein HZA42_01635 [Candidatus Peregrinibacteria bacterium]|nr:hypothetical protein [Candidatus Peregrinibacteria bacterium]
MIAFHYIALNQAGKELSGVVEAQDEVAARKNLNQLGLSIVSLKAIEAGVTGVAPAEGAAPVSAKPIFEFEAVDKSGKKVAGTIKADDDVKAFARLFGEYQFNVNSIYSASASLEEKEAARKAGILEIKQKYEKIYGAAENKAKEAADAQTAQEQQQRGELMQKIDFTMKRVEEFLKAYNADLKVEERDTIQGYLNQLVRIKDSTNLEHIRTTCERMLNHLQKQELFMHEEQKSKESAKMKVETKELLGQLKRTGLSQDIDIAKTVAKWKETPILKPLADLLLKIFKEQDPEVTKLKEEIKVLNRNIISYFKMLIAGKSKALRIEVWESIKALWEEKKRTKLKIEAIKTGKKMSAEAETGQRSVALEQAGTISGWVLAFYLLTYMVSYPFTIKFLPINLPASLYFYQPRITTAITIFLFLFYAATATVNFWLRKNKISAFLLYSTAFFCFLLIMVNLL